MWAQSARFKAGNALILAEIYDDEENLIGYRGYTHRGGQTFKIGDRLL